jgi:hypothetical protein
MISDEWLLFIEPAQPAALTPLLDPVTRRMCAAFRNARPGDVAYRGSHECLCGARSDCHDWFLPSGDRTNSLCVHYVAHHRPDVPPEQLPRIESFAAGEADPNEDELQGPQSILKRFRSSVRAVLGPERLTAWAALGFDAEAVCLGLQGRCLPPVQGHSPRQTRDDAEHLLDLLAGIEPDSIACIRRAAEQTHGDVRAWGNEALRTPGWKREAWVGPLVTLLRHSKGPQRQSAGARLRLLGPAVRAAVPTLIEMAEEDAEDTALQWDVSMVLSSLGLLDQLPPRPGQVGFCHYCQGSGACYCRRKVSAESERCPRCGGSGKCHLCRGTGRMAQ